MKTERSKNGAIPRMNTYGHADCLLLHSVYYKVSVRIRFRFSVWLVSGKQYS